LLEQYIDLLSRFLFWLHRNELARPHGLWPAHKIQRHREAKNILVYGNYQNEALEVKSQFSAANMPTARWVLPATIRGNLFLLFDMGSPRLFVIEKSLPRTPVEVQRTCSSTKLD
jgi:hypothetical protein